MRRCILPGMAAAGLMAAVLVPAQPAAADSVLTRGMGATIGTLDPQINFLAVEGQIEDDMYEGLVTPGPDGEPIPGAAAAWDISDDDKTYTFHVRDGLKWSNGEPLVAQDFVNGIVRTWIRRRPRRRRTSSPPRSPSPARPTSTRARPRIPGASACPRRTSGPW